MRRSLAFSLLALLGSALLPALARTVEIVSADRLEVRRDDGQEIVVISGENVQLKIDRESITATRVEFNRTKRTLTLVGRGTYRSFVQDASGRESEQVLSGENLVVDLATQDLAGEDVIVSTANLEIRGEDVERVPGQLSVRDGYFTPCAKCGRTPNDYGVRAQQVFLYPGDRIVAYGATLLLADAPVAYLPALVLFLNDPDRQPRISFGQSDVDGFTARLDLPFVIGTTAQGFTLLRYYGNRTPRFGLGVDMTAYDLPLGLQRLDLYALANPKPTADSEDGYDIDFRVRGRGLLDADFTKSGVSYTFEATRSDSLTLSNATVPADGIANVDVTAKAEVGDFDFSVRYLDRFGPEPTGAALPTVLRRPELDIQYDGYKAGDFSADFGVTVGNYRGAVREGSQLARQGIFNVSAGRLAETHTLSFSAKPWDGTQLNLSNSYSGQFYSTGQRVVSYTVGAGLTQSFGTNYSASLNYVYTRDEGVGPFSTSIFPSYPVRRLSSVLTASVNGRPTSNLSFGVSQAYDFFKERDSQTPTRFTVNLTPTPGFPVSLNGTLEYDAFEQSVQRWTLNSTIGGTGVTNRGFSVSFDTGYDIRGGFSPLNTTLAYVADTGDTASFRATYDLNDHELDTIQTKLKATSTYDAILNPVSLDVDLTFGVSNPQYTGTQSVTWRDVTFSSQQNFLLPDAKVEPGQDNANGKCPPNASSSLEGCGTLTFRVAGPSGALNSWNATFGGSYDLLRGGWTNPTLAGQLQVTNGSNRFVAQATVNVPGLESQYLELANAGLSGQLDITPRVGIGGDVRYVRTRVGEAVTETLTLNPLNLTFGLGRNERPDAYLTFGLQQTLTFGANLPRTPLQPIVKLTVDRCCWAFQFELNPVQRLARFSLSLPAGGGQSIEFTPEGPRLPGLLSGGTP
ncbi:LPS-assembly protein LptD [Deinococcus yavapaiensis]|uniref:Lipopolysaccharide assembly outer membrane protein LptD (OstA) n=1 Tax=Deinococcus yavapaiensis KR-236 TaxID=694435 RepID=A0A318S859_9DEIO|nr:LPS-assembly protein LptD [Deinococcus yavapaiensis]PYE54204.1 lipopolysaccharide assembly outer membrane protein LptD (OstA) [Deinococcus yavapaiensis KR-236]